MPVNSYNNKNQSIKCIGNKVIKNFVNHKAASREQNIKLDTTSEESDDEMINTLNKSQKSELLQTNC